jgi:hypothetical protein
MDAREKKQTNRIKSASGELNMGSCIWLIATITTYNSLLLAARTQSGGLEAIPAPSGATALPLGSCSCLSRFSAILVQEPDRVQHAIQRFLPPVLHILTLFLLVSVPQESFCIEDLEFEFVRNLPRTAVVLLSGTVKMASVQHLCISTERISCNRDRARLSPRTS